MADFGLMTVPQACAQMGWAPKTVQNWVKAGLLPAAVVGSTGRLEIFVKGARAVDLLGTGRGTAVHLRRGP